MNCSPGKKEASLCISSKFLGMCCIPAVFAAGKSFALPWNETQGQQIQNQFTSRTSTEIPYKVKEKKIMMMMMFAKSRTQGLFLVLLLIPAAFRSQTGGFVHKSNIGRELRRKIR